MKEIRTFKNASVALEKGVLTVDAAYIRCRSSYNNVVISEDGGVYTVTGQLEYGNCNWKERKVTATDLLLYTEDSFRTKKPWFGPAYMVLKAGWIKYKNPGFSTFTTTHINIIE